MALPFMSHAGSRVAPENVSFTVGVVISEAGHPPGPVGHGGQVAFGITAEPFMRQT